MHMARVNVYLPDELAKKARAAGLNVSGLTQDALRRALAVQRTNDWLEQVGKLRRSGLTHDDVMVALEAAREEFGRLDG